MRFAERIKGLKTWMSGTIISLIFTVRIACLPDEHLVGALRDVPYLLGGFAVLIGAAKATEAAKIYASNRRPSSEKTTGA